MESQQSARSPNELPTGQKPIMVRHMKSNDSNHCFHTEHLYPR